MAYYYIVVLYSSGQVGKWSQWLRSNNIVLVATALLRQRDRPLVSYRDGHFRLMHGNWPVAGCLIAPCVYTGYCYRLHSRACHDRKSPLMTFYSNVHNIMEVDPLVICSIAVYIHVMVVRKPYVVLISR